jgi:uncharacterized membrane protein
MDNAVLVIGVYDDVDMAMGDLDGLEQAHREKVVGKFDAAVIDKHDGKPHIHKRMDRPQYNVIAEWFGGGTLPRGDLHDAADSLLEGQAALVAVGEPTLDKAVEKAVTHANKIAKKTLDKTADELGTELSAGIKN